MKFLINNNIDPAINHAIEEHLLKDTDGSFFMLWRNRPSLLLGKNQDAFAELNFEYVESNDIDIVRRLSGGGTVFCDLGNMQYTLITDINSETCGNSFELFSGPVVSALKNLGLNAEFTGRNDILIDGKKISGNAQYKYKNRIIHHGTILFDVNMDMLKGAINSRPIKFTNKAVKSVSSRVGTIHEYLPEYDVVEFMNYLSEYVMEFYGIKEKDEVNDEVLRKAEPYIHRFRDPKWNLGKRYTDSIEMSIKYPFGLVDYKLRVDDGKIIDIGFHGDFFSDLEIENLRERLIGNDLNTAVLEDVICDLNVDNYINGMNNKLLISDLMRMYKGA